MKKWLPCIFGGLGLGLGLGLEALRRMVVIGADRNFEMNRVKGVAF